LSTSLKLIKIATQNDKQQKKRRITMTYINIDLRLTNLTSFTALQAFFRSFYLTDKKTATSSNKVAIKAGNDSADYYAAAAKKDTTLVSIERQLAAYGNAW